MSLVSIIMNCHNGEKHLRNAIDSVYSQSIKDWEIIFYNNLSTDKSKKISLSYDRKIKYFESKKFINLGEARKKAIDNASGKWIAFLDVDDYWYSNKLELQLNHLENSNYMLCYSAIDYITESGKYLKTKYPTNGSGDILSNLLVNFDINLVTAIFRNDLAQKYKLEFNKNMQVSEEYNFFMKLAYYGKILSINESLGAYRVSDNSLTNKKKFRWAFERDTTLKELNNIDKYYKKINLSAFEVALARSRYYRACYYMDRGSKIRARISLKKIKKIDLRYKILFYISLSTLIWNFLHDRKIKILVTELYNRLNFQK